MAQMSPQQAQDQDNQLTAFVLGEGEGMLQPVLSNTFTPNGSNNTVTVAMKPVGLTRGFLLKVSASYSNAGSGTATLTPWGAANVLSNVTLTDLDNYQRINTTGWHLNMLGTAKEGFPFGAALLATATDSPVKYGNNFAAMSAPATLGAGNVTPTTGVVNMYYWIPCAYGKRDLRGAIYTGVVNATGFVSFTVNPNFTVTSGDATLAVFSGASTTVTCTGVTWTLYQDYIDQIPKYTSGPNRGAPILPPISMRTQYRLMNTSLTGISVNQDFPIPFTNFQAFLSAGVIYDQVGTLAAGTDINQWKFAAANTLQFFNLDPITQALRTRTRIRTDLPLGSYMFDFREQPVNTNQAGNMQLLLNASSAALGSQALVAWESFALTDAILGAQSLPAN